MKFKSSLTLPTDPPKKQPTFPLLARSKTVAVVVLFKSPNSGVIVHNPGSYDDRPVGYFSCTWIHPNDETYWEILPPGTEIKIILES